MQNRERSIEEIRSSLRRVHNDLASSLGETSGQIRARIYATTPRSVPEHTSSEVPVIPLVTTRDVVPPPR